MRGRLVQNIIFRETKYDGDRGPMHRVSALAEIKAYMEIPSEVLMRSPYHIMRECKNMLRKRILGHVYRNLIKNIHELRTVCFDMAEIKEDPELMYELRKRFDEIYKEFDALQEG